jgi:hypothetical protein
MTSTCCCSRTRSSRIQAPRQRSKWLPGLGSTLYWALTRPPSSSSHSVLKWLRKIGFFTQSYRCENCREHLVSISFVKSLELAKSFFQQVNILVFFNKNLLLKVQVFSQQFRKQIFGEVKFLNKCTDIYGVDCVQVRRPANATL